ncbi:MAG: DUF839 domain-containing protein [Actinobacteria bacterium]|nr:DUF839 domain-containing protein [Actinomycetota bacterium]
MTTLDRRTFLKRGTFVAGGMTIAGPLQALARRIALGETLTAEGYGPLVDMGDLYLPEGFHYRIISRTGEPMSDGNPAPTRFDGMSAFTAPDGSTVLVRNHENRRRLRPDGRVNAPLGEIDVQVSPADLRYDPNPVFNGGVTKLTVQDRNVVASRAVLGGTIANCAGGKTRWGSWITCEEFFAPPPPTVFPPESARHGYIFEAPAFVDAPVKAVPIVAAGRFEHEAVAWEEGALYETEDQPDASFYRFTPAHGPRAHGDLAAGNGTLEALKVTDAFALDTRAGITGGVGTSLAVEWVPIENPDPPSDAVPPVGGDITQYGVRYQAQARGAAIFRRTEGCWSEDGHVFFDCTNGGAAGLGQIWHLDVELNTLTLVYESQSIETLNKPDNLTVSPTEDLFICEDLGDGLATAPHIRAITKGGQIYNFAKAKANTTEFCGACFNPKPLGGYRGTKFENLTLFVNQQGSPPTGVPGVTYAIWGPWKRTD